MSLRDSPTALHAPTALLPAGWADDVVVRVATHGRIESVARGITDPPADAERLAGPLLPGMANLHSHAFQRALAGRTERKGSAEDSFWTWRSRMYELVARIGPGDLETIAAWLYVEMLEAGYTAVGEFHYLHRDPAGRAYADPAEMSRRVLGAAAATGIALTLLPVLYHCGDFGGRAAGDGQRRFLHGPEAFVALLESLSTDLASARDLRLGMAPHSLRAVTPESLRLALDGLDRLAPGAPVHIHVAEQVAEVEACLAWSRSRPVAWLLDHAPVDGRWCLVHATHVTPEEVSGVAASGAVVGLCPTTEANLGDGLFPLEDLLGAGGRYGIGSDSHVSVSPVEELRLAEYGRRLALLRRAVVASEDTPSVGRTLYEHAARGGAQALGLPAGRIEAGMRADLVVLDANAPSLMGAVGDGILDALVFSGNVSPVRHVMVSGRWLVRDGRHRERERHLHGYRAALSRLWT